MAHGAALIALTIDEVGMAKTRERKLEVAKRIVDLVCDQHGMDPRAADLRRADVHADHRRRGVEAVRGRDDRGHPADQVRAAGREDVARRLQRVASASALPARIGPELRLPASLRRGRARPGDGQPEPHHALRRDPGRRARARRRPRLQPPRRRAGDLHPALRGQGPGGRGRGGRPDRGHGARGGAALAHPAPQARRRGGADRRVASRRSAPSRRSTPCCCRP